MEYLTRTITYTLYIDGMNHSLEISIKYPACEEMDQVMKDISSAVDSSVDKFKAAQHPNFT
jgi:hypothetical protein